MIRLDRLPRVPVVVAATAFGFCVCICRFRHLMLRRSFPVLARGSRHERSRHILHDFAVRVVELSRRDVVRHLPQSRGKFVVEALFVAVPCGSHYVQHNRLTDLDAGALDRRMVLQGWLAQLLISQRSSPSRPLPTQRCSTTSWHSLGRSSRPFDDRVEPSFPSPTLVGSLVVADAVGCVAPVNCCKMRAGCTPSLLTSRGNLL